MTTPDADGAPDRGGIRAELSDRVERWLVPTVRWVRRTLWLPIAAGIGAALVGAATAIVVHDVDTDGVLLALVVATVLSLPALGVAFFVRLLGELERLPDTIRAAPEQAGELRDELASAGAELRDLRSSGLLALPSVLRWLRRTLGRLDAVGVAGVTAAVAALHPLRLAWILLLCWLSVLALPVAIAALLLAL